jgi:hypothetical protein
MVVFFTELLRRPPELIDGVELWTTVGQRLES